MTAVTRDAAFYLVRKYLAALRNYPPRVEAEGRLADTIQEVAVSIEHAEAFLQSFDDICPTPREIKEAALNLRDRFSATPSQREQWEKQYGPPNQEWSRDIIRAATGNKNQDFKNQLTDMRQQAIRDSLYYIEGPGRHEIAGNTKEKRESQQFWQNAMSHHLREHPEEVASIREQIATGQIGPVPPPPDKPSDERKQVRTVTAADVEEARRRLKGRDADESPSSPPPL